jgi:hypothetical protein
LPVNLAKSLSSSVETRKKFASFLADSSMLTILEGKTHEFGVVAGLENRLAPSRQRLQRRPQGLLPEMSPVSLPSSRPLYKSMFAGS